MTLVPHPSAIFKGLKEQLDSGKGEIAVDRATFIRLVDCYISSWDFDEEFYLKTYPDVADAIAKGVFASAWLHFRTAGFFEGRMSAAPSVNPEWYLKTYPDVAQAMLHGDVKGPREHFEEFGRAEGRLPRKPTVNSDWYRRRYLPADEKSDAAACEKHFIEVGYLGCAVPQRPK